MMRPLQRFFYCQPFYVNWWKKEIFLINFFFSFQVCVCEKEGFVSLLFYFLTLVGVSQCLFYTVELAPGSGMDHSFFLKSLQQSITAFIQSLFGWRSLFCQVHFRHEKTDVGKSFVLDNRLLLHILTFSPYCHGHKVLNWHWTVSNNRFWRAFSATQKFELALDCLKS